MPLYIRESNYLADDSLSILAQRRKGAGGVEAFSASPRLCASMKKFIHRSTVFSFVYFVCFVVSYQEKRDAA